MIIISNLTESDKENILILLQEKTPVLKIAERYKVHKTTMYKYIKKHNLQLNGDLRKISFSQQDLYEIKRLYLEMGLSMKKIGILYNANEEVIKRSLKELNVEIRHSGQQYCYNSHYFEKIDTENKAYFLGLITSDGNLTNPSSNKNTHTVQINLQEEDVIVLNILAEDIITGGRKLKPLFINRTKENVKNQYKISLNNKNIFNDLVKLGLSERKSLTLNSLCSEVPDKLFNHYIRGLFDGDGTANINSDLSCKIGYYCGSENFIQSFQKHCIKAIQMSELKIYRGSTFFCSWSKIEDITKFFNYIYKDATVYLPRKYNKILEMFKIKENSEEIIIPKKILTP